MLERFPARSGRWSLRVGGTALHSPYDPVKEAARFVESSLAGEHPSTVVLLGEALGYASELIRERFPSARLIPVFYSEEIFRLSSPALADCWHPGMDRRLADFLRERVGDLDVEGLRVAEWPPSARLYPGLSLEANRAVQQAVQEANGSVFTTAAAGKLWLRNSILNFLSVDGELAENPCPPQATVVIAASGPSLEEDLPAIRGCRASVQLWALPSSLPALKQAGLEPDLVVMTDPSHWSISHMHFARPSCPVAMPLAAARGAWRLGAPLLLLAQPVFYEVELLARAGIRAPLVAPHGTVAATAIDLALASTTSKVVAAGLDLCVRDLASHARPNAFDTLAMLGSGRLGPHHSRSYARAVDPGFETIPGSRPPVRVPRSLRAYAGWMESRAAEPSAAGRLWRLNPSPVDLPSLPGMALSELGAAAGPTLPARGAGRRGPRTGGDRGPARPGNSLPAAARRREIAAGLLSEWEGVLAEGLSAVRGAGDASPLMQDRRLLTHAYLIDASRVVESRRCARLGKGGEAYGLTVGLLEGAVDFLRKQRAKIGG